MCDIVRIECSLIIIVVIMPQQPAPLDTSTLTFDQIIEKIEELKAVQTE